MGLPKGEAIPIQTHCPTTLGHSLFGGAEGGRISPSSHPTHESAWSCRGKKKTNKQGPKHFLQPQAVTYLLVHFKFKMEKKTPTK